MLPHDEVLLATASHPTPYFPLATVHQDICSNFLTTNTLGPSAEDLCQPRLPGATRYTPPPPGGTKVLALITMFWYAAKVVHFFPKRKEEE